MTSINNLKCVYKDFTELLSGGITIASTKLLSGENVRVLTSLVQLDGDVCLKIHKGAWQMKNLNQVIEEHISEVSSRVESLESVLIKSRSYLRYLWAGLGTLTCLDVINETALNGAELIKTIYEPNALLSIIYSFSGLSIIAKLIGPKVICWWLMRKISSEDQLPARRSLT